METLNSLENRYDELEGRFAEQKANLKDLAMMGTVITSIHEIHAVLSVVMEMSIRLVDGEVGGILLHENDELVGKASWGVNYDFLKTLMYEEDQTLISYCQQNQETIILQSLGVRSEEGMAIESIICAPIKTSETCYGTIIIINKSDGSDYTEDDKEMLEMLLTYVAVAIENSILMQERLATQKIEQEMAIAKQIQETILPQNIDEFEGVEIGAVYFPARDVGGDFYDVVKLEDNKFVIIMGDVSNKGVPAALVMSAVSAIIKSTLKQNKDISIAELAETTNTLLSTEIIKEREMFVTLFFCKYDFDEMKITFCNAGHLPGLFYDIEEHKVIELAVGGPIIGQFPDIPFKQGEQSFKKGDRLFLFTDGLTEAADDKGQLFGRERAELVVSNEYHLPPKEFCLKVKEWVDRFTVGCADDMVDDFTIMQVKAE